MGKRGFQQKGYPNPLLIRKKPTPAQDTDKSIKNYLGRPRPTLDEVKSVVAEKESKSKQMARFEDSQNKDYRKELDKYRKKMMKKEEKKKRKEEKKRRKLEKKKDNNEAKSDSESEERTKGGSPVQLSKFFSFAGNDISDGEIPLSDDETTEAINKTTTIQSTPATTPQPAQTTTTPSTNTTTATTTTTSETSETQGRKRKRWDEKPAIFQNQVLPPPSTLSLLPNPPLPQIPLTAIPIQLPLATILTPVSNIQLFQQLQIQQLQLASMQQASLLPLQPILNQPTLPFQQAVFINPQIINPQILNPQLLNPKPPP